MATNGSNDHSLVEAGTTSVWPDKIIPPPFNFCFPVMVENKKVGAGLYLTPFLKDKYDDYGHYMYSNFNESYLLNLRLRYIKDISKKINGFFDMVYGGKDVFENSPADLGWLEFGFHYRINYSFRLFVGYKQTLYSNKEIDIDSFFINFTFGHSFLRK